MSSTMIKYCILKTGVTRVLKCDGQKVEEGFGGTGDYKQLRKVLSNCFSSLCEASELKFRNNDRGGQM